MPRTARASRGNVCHHVMNRGNNRNTIFHDEVDYRFFESLLLRAKSRIPIDVFAWCLMPNHFHLVLRPRLDGDLGRWIHWLMTCQVHHHRKRHRVNGRIWEGRFKAPPIQENDHFLTVVRYVERNPVRAGIVDDVMNWRWSSFQRRTCNDDPLLDPSPLELPKLWRSFVNEPLTTDELAAVRTSLNREQPYGDHDWVQETAERLGLLSKLRPIGRPRSDIL
ncbi:MAG: transposase [Acidobacteria bacterium]|uniref:Transposase n=1 Tax=Candidatus Polarisedimenticola svalbardensis TaxID=2886004 RepID=A0A8J6XZQ0_9BACT|nr:transposase [Candidatus Polarisedimenticola svalbardensis]